MDEKKDRVVSLFREMTQGCKKKRRSVRKQQHQAQSTQTTTIGDLTILVCGASGLEHALQELLGHLLNRQRHSSG